MVRCPQCDTETPADHGRCISCNAVLPAELGRVTPPADPPDDPDLTRASQPGATSSIRESGSGGPFAPGSIFAGRYRIERMLGAGGMGAVYQAWDQELGIAIALKVIRTEVITDPGAALDYERRFKQELLLARQVSHPNVARIHDLGDAAGIKYITMSYVEGSDLSGLLKQGPMPIARARHFALQLAAGLAAAHDVGIAHRDLKPQNLLIDGKDHLCISDFGLAKSLEPAAAGLTRTGEFLGTPRYISPEQVEGKPADHRGDLYAFGLILYEMVTGDAPFSGPSALELMLQRVQERPKSARLKNPEVPEYLDGIIMRCLERDPSARYQSAHEVLADLRAEESTRSMAPVKTARTISWTVPVPTSRTWMLTAGLATALVLLMAVAMMRGWLPVGGTPGEAVPDTPVEPLRLAILPFTVSGDAPALGYAAAGLEEALASKLFQLKQVNVAASSAVQRALRQSEALDHVGREVGATLIIAGSVQGTADQLLVTVNADDVAGSRRVWSQQFSGVPADLLTLQDQVFRSLVSGLDLALSTEEQVATLRNPTQDIDAYESYLMGRRAMRDDQDLANVQAAIGHYENAFGKDPRFALAYAGISDSYIRMYRATKEDSWARRALSAAEQARSIDDALPEVHLSLGTVYQAVGRTNEAIVELRRAADLAPNSDDAARRLGRAYLNSGRAEEAIAAYQKAIDINPYHWVNSASLGAAHMQLANFDAAISAFERVTRLAPDNVFGHADLGAAYLQSGRHDDAIGAFERALELQPVPGAHTNLAIAYAQTGRFNEAVRHFEKAVELQPNDERFVGNLGDGYRWAGQHERAAAAYDRAVTLALKDLSVNPRNATAKGNLALYYAKKGDTARARRFIGEARAIDSSNVDLVYGEAIICALADDVGCAVTNLERSLKEGYTLAILEGDPDLRRLRAQPQYQDLKKRAAAAGSAP
jgi:eukaryotic-like serine/threonine-protein kinase